MASSVEVELMTTEQFLQLPDDGVARALIAGRLVEYGSVTGRNWLHGWVESRVVYLLWAWVETQTEPRGGVVSGEALVRLRRDPDSTFGVDAAYLSPEQRRALPQTPGLIDGAPTLVVEVVSPSTKIGDLREKIEAYLAGGVAVVWVVHPQDQAVHIHRPGEELIVATRSQTIRGGDLLPGLEIPVARLFPE